MSSTLSQSAATQPRDVAHDPSAQSVDALTIALVQMSVTDRDPSLNVERATAMVLDHPGAQLYVLPELWTTGYAHDLWDWAADEHTPGALATLQGLADQRGAYIAGSMVSRAASGALVNRMWVVGPGWQTVASYDKCHLFPPMGEPERMEAGAGRVRVSLGGWNAALSICFDLRFPEMYRLDAVDGASLFVVSSAWPASRAELLRLFARARAAENQSYLALVNRVGPSSDGTEFGGGSALFGPDGSVIGEVGDGEGVVLATAERARLATLRAGLPVLASRRPGVDQL